MCIHVCGWCNSMLSLLCPLFRLQEERKEACQRALEKSCQVREKQTQMYAKLKPIVTSKSSGSLRRSVSPHSSQTMAAELLAARRANARNKLIAAETRANIDAFEATLKDRATVEPGSAEMQLSSKLTSEEKNENSCPTTKIVSGGYCCMCVSVCGRVMCFSCVWGGGVHGYMYVHRDKVIYMDIMLTVQMVKAGETEDYVSQIKKRVQVNWTEREEREKRRRRVLMDQMRAMHQQEVSLEIYYF